jgi:DNA-binding protein HU-beta
MNKAELIEVLTEKLDTDRAHATLAVEELISAIVRAVNKGESVTITGFGVFERRRRAARVARNLGSGVPSGSAIQGNCLWCTKSSD